MDSPEEFRSRVSRGESRDSALMLTELVGYTRLADSEPGRALKLLDEHNAVVKESIVRHQGIVAKVLGDAHLVEFPDAVSAARCALDIQFRINTRNAKVQEFQNMASRIGLHFGRVTPQGAELGGEGLRQLAQLSSRAPPRGGICVSEGFHELIKNKRGFEIQDLGEQRFDGAPRQHVYLIYVAGAPRAAAPPPDRGFFERSLLLKSVPSLAPLPLDLPPSDYAPEVELSGVRRKERSPAPFVAVGGGLLLGVVAIYFVFLRGPAATSSGPTDSPSPAPTATPRPATSRVITQPTPHPITQGDSHGPAAKKPLSNLERLRTALARVEKLPKAQQKKILPDLKDWKKVEREMSQGKKGADVDRKILAQLEKKLDEVERSGSHH